MKISIIVPIYNVEKYLEECFESIAAQTYEGELECIFVDDCGQDGSMALLEQLIAGYKGSIQMCTLHHEHNRGLSAARNTGIEYATGDYLYFLDSDDSITPDCIEKLSGLAKKYKGVDVVQGSTKSHLEGLSLKGKDVSKYSDDFKWIRTHFLYRTFIPITAWNKLVRTGFIKRHHLFFKEGLIHEDELWNFFLAKYVHTIAFCEDDTYIYRINNMGIMANESNNADTYIPVIDSVCEHISGPFVCKEIYYLQDLYGWYNSIRGLDKYLKRIPYNIHALHLLLFVRRYNLQKTHKRIAKMFSYLVLRIIESVINVTYES